MGEHTDIHTTCQSSALSSEIYGVCAVTAECLLYSFEQDDRQNLGLVGDDVTTPYVTLGDRFRQNGVARLHYVNRNHYDAIVFRQLHQVEET